MQTASRVEEIPHNIILFYRRPPPLDLEYTRTISVKISYSNTLYFRFCIINLRFYCKFYFIPAGLGPYIGNFTS